LQRYNEEEQARIAAKHEEEAATRLEVGLCTSNQVDP
jgi:hypothetical protein